MNSFATAIRPTATKLLRPRPRTTTIHHRTFFASSTDHSILLANAEAHTQPLSPTSTKYFLVPRDTPLEVAQAAPQLQLAWLHVENGNVIHSCKVLQRTLGEPVDVCGRLLDMALEDIHKGAQGPPMAVVTLHGLCRHVADGLNGESPGAALAKLMAAEDDSSLEAVRAMATNVPRAGHSVVGMGTYRDGEVGWRAVAEEFVNQGRMKEGALFESRGGALEEIVHMGDTGSDALREAGGAVAKFGFSR